MTSIRFKRKMATAVAAFSIFGSAQAGNLVLLPDGLEVLDTNTNLIWLYDWLDNPGLPWTQAKSWAASLTVGAVPAGTWALPSIDQYNTLWIDVGSVNTGLYSNFIVGHQDHYTQSSTEHTPGVYVWLFNPRDGANLAGGEGSGYGTTAVRAVPEAQTVAMMLLGLALLNITARRRRD